MSIWALRSPEQKQRLIAQRRERRALARQAKQAAPTPSTLPTEDQLLTAQVQAQYTAHLHAYEAGTALHPTTERYVHEDTLTNAKRGALIAWRKGYRVTEDGRFWHPKGYELHPGYTSNIVAGEKHHRSFRSPRKRNRQPKLQYRPETLAALCFYGPVVLRDDYLIHLVDGNWCNRARANLVLRPKAEHDRLRRKQVPVVASPVLSNGRRKRGRVLNAEQAQAIRTLLRLGRNRKEVVALLAERGVEIRESTVGAIERGNRWY